ncbi:hypothetical protein AALP_AA2G096500 [Arabis alpina]|uniref:Uncharacterized protein n=1 Tax=Arabis alpina TaxID=50452 RepID=A0A087HGD1_ARAAL|nr:hypothetical protein AALP_AA2G096500 [Arabis alpina]
MASCPSIVFHVLTTCDLGPRDLAKLEATCSFFRKPANFSPDFELSISEVAALDICQKRAIFKRMGEEERQEIKRKWGGSWKLILKEPLKTVGSLDQSSYYLLPHPLLGALENIPVMQIAAGYCYLLALACQPTGMSVYSVKCGLSGKLGHWAWHAVVVGKDGWSVYSFGCGESANLGQGDVDENTLTPKLVSSLKKTKERVVHVSLKNSVYWTGHTFEMTESGTLYVFGVGDRGQLGVELGDSSTERVKPTKVVGIDLS